MRTLVMVAALFIPGTLKALKAMDGIKKESLEVSKQRMQDSEEDNLKKNDILSQLFRIIREKGHDINFSYNEVVLESRIGM